MTSNPDRARAAFDRIAAQLAGRDGVTSGTGFGSNPGLRVGGKIFAMLSDDRLVVKLPAGRVDELAAESVAERFDAGKGRPMREWATVGAEHTVRWPALADEAFGFVGGAAKQG
jgi:hypothetical protein